MLHSGGELRLHSKESKEFKVFEVKIIRKIPGTKSAEIMGFWFVTPFGVVYTYQHFEGSWNIYLNQS